VFAVALLTGVLGQSALADPAPSPAALPQTGLPATLTLEQIREGFARAREELRSLLVEYQTSGSSTQDGKTSPVDLYGIVAARGLYRFVDYAHAGNRQEWETSRQRTRVIYTGKTLDVFFTSQRIYETSVKNAQSESTLKVKNDFVLDCLGWWPPDDPTPVPLIQGVRPFYLHAILSPQGQRAFTPPTIAGILGAVSAPSLPTVAGTLADVALKERRFALPDFRVLPRQEQVDGAWCHVLDQPGCDRLWIDPKVGFRARRRELYSGTSPDLVARYELSDFRECSGVWIPWTFSRTQIFPNQRTGAPNGLRLQADATVVRAEVNQTPEEFFHFQPPPGTLVRNRDTTEITQVPGGRDLLDSEIETVRRPVAQGTLDLRTAAQKWETSGAFLAVFLAVGLTGWVVWIVWRGRREPTGSVAAAPVAQAPERKPTPNGQGPVQVEVGPSPLGRTP
jgi:hypothetical protein